MINNKVADRISNIHSDIRGPVFFKALEMEKQGQKVLKVTLRLSALKCLIALKTT